MNNKIEKGKINMILKFKKVELSKQRTCMCIEIGESNFTDCFPLYYCKFWGFLIIFISQADPGGGGGYSGFQMKATIEGFFWVF